MLPDDCPRPKFRSVSLYNDALGKLSFWRPTEWHLEEDSGPAPAVTLWPRPDDPLTMIRVEVRDLLQPLADGEEQVLLDGIREGLVSLDDCQVLTWRQLEDDEIGDWGVEYLCRLRLDDSLCERQARMFICGQDFYTVTFQGSSHTQFEYWKGMFEFVMLTVAAVNFSVPDWFVDQTAADGETIV